MIAVCAFVAAAVLFCLRLRHLDTDQLRQATNFVTGFAWGSALALALMTDPRYWILFGLGLALSVTHILLSQSAQKKSGSS